MNYTFIYICFIDLHVVIGLTSKFTVNQPDIWLNVENSTVIVIFQLYKDSTTIKIAQYSVITTTNIIFNKSQYNSHFM